MTVKVALHYSSNVALSVIEKDMRQSFDLRDFEFRRVSVCVLSVKTREKRLLKVEKEKERDKLTKN
jgi:hypothetical protein